MHQEADLTWYLPSFSFITPFYTILIITPSILHSAYIPQSARKDKSQGQTQAKTHDGQAIPIPTKETPVPNRGPNAARFFDEIPKIAVTERQPRKQKEKGGDGTTDREPNPDLDSFEAVMDAMEKELARLTGPLPPSPSSFSPLPRSSNRSSAKKAKSEKKDVKGKGKATDTSIGMGKNMDVDMNEDGGDSDDEDDMAELQAAMDRELTSSLKRDKRDIKVVSSGSEDDEDDEGAYEGEVPMDYNLIKNFLESFKSQQGLSGPVGGLAGRLQGPSWTFPRDNS